MNSRSLLNAIRAELCPGSQSKTLGIHTDDLISYETTEHFNIFQLIVLVLQLLTFTALVHRSHRLQQQQRRNRH